MHALLLFSIGCGSEKELDTAEDTSAAEEIEAAEQEQSDSPPIDEDASEADSDDDDDNDDNDNDDDDNDNDDNDDDDNDDDDNDDDDNDDDDNDDDDNDDDDNDDDDTGSEDNSSSNDAEISESEESSNSSCSTHQLLWEAVAEHATDPTLPLTSSSTIVLIGRVTNPCSSAIELTTPSSCLVGGGLLFGQDTHLWNNTCSFNTTQWSIPAHSYIEQVEEFSSPAAGFYELQIYFADTNTHNGLLTFSVSP